MSRTMEANLKKSGLQTDKKRAIFGFIGELKEELKKVSWTTKQELLFCTKVVLLSTLFFGLGIYAVDLLIKGVLEGFKLSLNFIFG